MIGFNGSHCLMLDLYHEMKLKEVENDNDPTRTELP